MATGASRRREARTGQPGAEQQGRLGARRRASSAQDSRGAVWRGIAGAWVLGASAPGWRGVDGRGCWWGRGRLSAGIAALGPLQAWGAVLARPRRRRACRRARLRGGFVARTVSAQAQRVQGRSDASARRGRFGRLRGTPV
jgi:hypothetical protein